MKQYIKSNKNLFLAFGIYIGLIVISVLISRSIPQHPGYIGPIPFANLDGMHYLNIARFGYATYEQAFFPFFPLLIMFVSLLFHGNVLLSGMIISVICFITASFLLKELFMVDNGKRYSNWIVYFLVLFPTAFFFVSIYTESLFLSLLLGAILLARKKMFILASIVGAFASATRSVGVFLVILFLIEIIQQWKVLSKKTQLLSLLSTIIITPLGMISYMMYLWKVYGDPLLFFHVQPAFGAQRSGSKIILLPQVVFRYIKILLTIPVSNHDFWVALLEISMFSLTVLALLLFWKRIRLSYLIFSLCAILLPTVTGTLSSEPRYILVAFPLFFLFASIPSTKIKIVLLSTFSLLFIILASYFFQGYFIA